MIEFKTNTTYRGVSRVGEIAIEVIKRTEKTLVIKTTFGENRIRIRKQGDLETSCFKSWYFDANDIYSEEQMTEDCYYAAYYR